MKKVICIVGPTGSGKTSLSLHIAKTFNAEIINGDSVQVYKELNIGSAKIKKEDQMGIKHHLIDKVSLGKDYTVYHFQQDAREIIEQVDIPIIVGGSGLYIKAALYQYEFQPLASIEDVSIDQMIDYIKANDPNLIIDFKNERRIESAYKNLKSGSQRSLKNNKDKPLYDILLIYLDINRENLKLRLVKRLEEMLSSGFIQEVKKYQEDELNIIGYREIKKHLKKELSLDEAKEEIIKSSMRFAKRQKTWFLNQMNPHVFDALDDALHQKINALVDSFLKG